MLPMPAVFTKIDSEMKRAFSAGWQTIEGVPPFRIIDQSRRVTSRALDVGGGTVMQIRGNYDSLIEFEDGSRAVADWKTSAVRDELKSTYQRSLEAYAFALEHPACGTPMAIDRIGLGVFLPDAFVASEDGSRLMGRMTWIELTRNRSEFLDFMGSVGGLVAGRVPNPDRGCPYCAFRFAA